MVPATHVLRVDQRLDVGSMDSLAVLIAKLTGILPESLIAGVRVEEDMGASVMPLESLHACYLWWCEYRTALYNGQLCTTPFTSNTTSGRAWEFYCVLLLQASTLHSAIARELEDKELFRGFIDDEGFQESLRFNHVE